MEPCWTAIIGFTFFDLEVKTWTVCLERSSPKKLRAEGEAISAACRPPGFRPHPPKVTTGEHEVISLQHEGMVGQPGNTWLVVLGWD
jgi:hypothetical protein